MSPASKKEFFANLDGLRAIAALSVVLYHCSLWIPFPQTDFYNYTNFLLGFGDQGGLFGVKFFFMLSGFLITYRLISEDTKNGSIHLFSFYIRRCLRIWPLYYASVIVGFWIIPSIFDDQIAHSTPFLYLIFAANYDHIFNGSPSFSTLGVQWSVCVEEQFYLIWPLCIIIAARFRSMAFFLIASTVISELFALNQNTWESAYYSFFSCARFLTWGGLIAFVSKNHFTWIESALGRLTKSTTLFIYCASLLLLLFHNQIDSIHFLINYCLEVLPFMFFGFVILDQNYAKHSFIKFGRWPLLNSIGKISYGIYLLHMIPIYLIISLGKTLPGNYYLTTVCIVIITTSIISSLSFNFIEMPFLRLKERYNRV